MAPALCTDLKTPPWRLADQFLMCLNFKWTFGQFHGMFIRTCFCCCVDPGNWTQPSAERLQKLLVVSPCSNCGKRYQLFSQVQLGNGLVGDMFHDVRLEPLVPDPRSCQALWGADQRLYSRPRGRVPSSANYTLSSLRLQAPQPLPCVLLHLKWRRYWSPRLRQKKN